MLRTFTLIIATLALLCGPHTLAASDGELHSASTGNIGITLNIAEPVSAQPLGDVSLTVDGDSASTLCLQSAMGNSFTVRALGDGPDHQLMLRSAASDLRYDVLFPKRSAVSKPGCEVGQTQTDLRVVMADRDALASSTRIYSGTLTLLFAPN